MECVCAHVHMHCPFHRPMPERGMGIQGLLPRHPSVPRAALIGVSCFLFMAV